MKALLEVVDKPVSPAEALACIVAALVFFWSALVCSPLYRLKRADWLSPVAGACCSLVAVVIAPFAPEIALSFLLPASFCAGWMLGHATREDEHPSWKVLTWLPGPAVCFWGLLILLAFGVHFVSSLVLAAYDTSSVTCLVHIAIIFGGYWWLGRLISKVAERSWRRSQAALEVARQCRLNEAIYEYRHSLRVARQERRRTEASALRTFKHKMDDLAHSPEYKSWRAACDALDRPRVC